MKLKKWLKSAPLSRNALAARLGITRQALYNITNGAKPKLALALKIEKETGGNVTLQDLV